MSGKARAGSRWRFNGWPSLREGARHARQKCGAAELATRPPAACAALGHPRRVSSTMALTRPALLPARGGCAEARQRLPARAFDEPWVAFAEGEAARVLCGSAAVMVRQRSIIRGWRKRKVDA